MNCPHCKLSLLMILIVIPLAAGVVIAQSPSPKKDLPTAQNNSQTSRQQCERIYKNRSDAIIRKQWDFLVSAARQYISHCLGTFAKPLIDEADALEDIALGLQREGKNEDAVPISQKCAAILPDYAWCYLSLADSFEALSRLSEAQQAYQRAASITGYDESDREWARYNAAGIEFAKESLARISAENLSLPKNRQSARTDAPSSSTGEGQVPQISSPAYHYYQELLSSGDDEIRLGTYACFDDDPQSKAFMVISASFLSKQSLVVRIVRFASGVSDPNGPDWFQGPLSPFSTNSSLFATLQTRLSFPPYSGHETDAFEWRPDLLIIKTGFGKLLQGQLRISYEFKMQRSTGRYTEQTVIGNGLEPDGGTVANSGKCINIPNRQTPEEEYRSLK